MLNIICNRAIYHSQCTLEHFAFFFVGGAGMIIYFVYFTFDIFIFILFISFYFYLFYYFFFLCILYLFIHPLISQFPNFSQFIIAIFIS